jgi:PTH1 family peptidyl-tRNA hydrolase
MYVIVGLGNPGRQYELTKHNIGFVAVDMLSERHGIMVKKLKHKALIGEGRIGGSKVLIVKPQTYMNLSGESVRSILAYYDLAPEQLVVVYDDVDIPMGRIRIRGFGSAGTHNGMRSIIYQIRSDRFPRVRIGIGAERGEQPLADYVLGSFAQMQTDIIKASVVKAVSAVETIVSDGIEAAMSRCNG